MKSRGVFLLIGVVGAANLPAQEITGPPPATGENPVTPPPTSGASTNVIPRLPPQPLPETPTETDTLPESIAPGLGLVSTNLPAFRQFGPNTEYLQARIPVAPWLLEERALPAQGNIEAPAPQFAPPGLGTSSLDNPFDSGSGGGRSSAAAPIWVGPFDVELSLRYNVLYATSTLSQPGVESDTMLHTVSPSVRINAGEHWSLSYRPNFRLYTIGPYDDSFDQRVTLSGWASTSDWNFTFSHGTFFSNLPLIETASQTEQQNHLTHLGASVDLSPIWSLSFSLSQGIRLTDDFASSVNWRNENRLNYKWRSNTDLSAGINVGYALQDDTSDILREGFFGEISSSPTPKWDYSVRAGVEFRQFIETGGSTDPSPLFRLGIGYAVLDRTFLRLSATHGFSTSYYTDQFNQTTTLDAGVTHSLTPRWNLAAGGGYRFTDYRTTTGNNESVRGDSTGYGRGSISWSVFSRLSTSLAYTYRFNESDQTGYSFGSHQLALSMNYTF